MTPVILTGERLVLTELREADIERVLEYCRDPHFEQYMATPWPYEREHAEFFVRDYAGGGWQRGDEATWAIREQIDGELLGAIGVRIPSGSVGFWLGAPHRGRGLMTEAFELVAEWALSPDGAGLERLTWEAAIGNTASAALARAVGFRYRGERPGEVLGRDGEPVPSWTATMRADDRGTRSEWPMLP
ncbi:GNAT family N-acetyltransferase [Salinibacterium sp. ZJ77]|uniref:GNAT family N-acetyltransferase n=1 Tax=Salinibacterium sp. ZJ77 TaxID=2708337 RepID=UPI00142170C4|nr:GNAT family N-acetyltransferase [Salinibacterium sp. ZJ77]